MTTMNLPHKAAGVTRPLVSTVIRGDKHGRLVESLQRDRYGNSEMPQAFQYGVIIGAYKQVSFMAVSDFSIDIIGLVVSRKSVELPQICAGFDPYCGWTLAYLLTQ